MNILKEVAKYGGLAAKIAVGIVAIGAGIHIGLKAGDGLIKGIDELCDKTPGFLKKGWDALTGLVKKADEVPAATE